MKNCFLLWKRSLKTRVTLATLVIFLASIWSLAWFAVHTLRRDMRDLLGSAQFSSVTLLASQIGEEVATRRKALEKIALTIAPEDMGSPEVLNARLASHPVFQDLFSGGAFITGRDGIAVASFPPGQPRIGLDYSDRDYFRSAVGRGLPAIGRPVVGRALGRPVLAFSHPIREGNGEVLGMLAGIVDIGTSTFMEQIASQPYGDRGAYLIVSREHRQIVVASDKRRILEVLPPDGVNPVLDEFMGGYEGTRIYVNSQGIEVLASIKRISSADWYAAVSVPTVEVFAPVDNTRLRIAGAAVLLTLLAGSLTWLILRRELLPLESTAEMLAAISESGRMPEQLPVERRDEIGKFIYGFNCLLHELTRRQARLVESEERYRTAFRTSPDALALSRMADGYFLDVNDGYTDLAEWSRNEIIGHTAMELGIWSNQDDRRKFVQSLEKSGHCRMETELTSKSGRRITVRISASKLMVGNEACILSVIHDLTAHRAAQRQIRQLEYLDPLTGLPNRRRFMEQLEQSIAVAVRYRRHGALLHVDLADFKTLNDTFGHDEGDALLKAVARRIQDCVTSGDMVARIGGDEFVILLEDLDGDAGKAAAQAEAVARFIHASLEAPFDLPHLRYRTGGCIGITVFGQHNEQAAEPLKRADLAMHQAKGAGRNKTFFFEPQMQILVNARAAMESSLRHAIEHDELQLFYQVQVDSLGKAHGAEALVRWHDPKRGLVSPCEFIPLAESTGLIIPLGQWVLETACRRLADWARRPDFAHLTVAVNVSSTQFRQDDFVDQVLAALRLTGANPNRLKLELTESTLVADIDEVVTKMNALKGMGIGFALDDFGTGFSSLSYLKRLPLDQLKIDQSFVRDILVEANDMAIAKMVVALGNSLGLQVIAEGVETSAQRETLADIGCGHYQGFLFGRPVQAHEFERCLRPMVSA